MNFLENITFRSTRTRTEPEDDSITSQAVNETTNNSMPDLSEDDDDSEIKTLTNEIEKLTIQLNGAHKEIEILSLENNNLKQTNDELRKRNELLENSNSNSPCKQRATTTKKSTNTKETQTEPDSTVSPSKNSQILTTQKKSQVESQKKGNNKRLDKPGAPMESAKRVSTEGTLQIQDPKATKSESTKNKICIVSANKVNNILSIAEDTFQNHQICHYISPNCGLLRLLSNLHQKVIDYTMKDHCIILVGEEDFQKTNNYVEIIIEARRILEEIKHTNIILCVPTFQLSDYSTMFNWRIETFNNLLQLDLQTYNYATAFDSNLDLFYDFTMFSKVNRKINDCGMRNIFRNLQLMISEDLSTECKAIDNESVSPSREFFL